ncbi:MAG TPA: peptidase S10 [Acidobacteriota bacterium]|nr:peptidase S10 [Acidobacteriota bacterium]
MIRLLRILLLCVFTVYALALFAQSPETKPAEKTGEKAPESGAKEQPKEESSVTDHSLKIGSQAIPYKATAGTIMLKNEKDEPEALVGYTAYTRSDTKDNSRRPISFLYNGGPGSSSIWLHMGAFGPRRVNAVDVGGPTTPPFNLVDNAESLIDVSDLVFIDPVGTGFSHAVGESKDKDFWGVDEDVASLAQFIQLYISRNNRWNSPKFLIGESYGTFRSVALVDSLQSKDGMYFNGIVLVSSVLNLGTISFHPGEEMTYVFYLPSYAATAWTQNMVKDRPQSLDSFLNDARQFAQTDYAAALIKGKALTAAEKAAVVKKLSYFTGLSEDYLTKADMRVNLGQFMQELQRSRGLVTGRLDARFTGSAYDQLSEFSEYDPQDTAITGPFVAAFNTYVREELKFGQQKTYHPQGEVFNDWDWKHKGSGFGFPGAPNVANDLVDALLTNPHLKVEVENGMYDLATPFFATEYTMSHLGLPEKLQGNIQLNYYEAGHMMYVRDADRAKLKANVANFITSASKTQ